MGGTWTGTGRMYWVEGGGNSGDRAIKFSVYNTVFSFDAGNRRISPAIAIKSPAMNFPSMALMLKNKSSCLYYFNSVSLSFAGMYSQSEQGII